MSLKLKTLCQNIECHLQGLISSLNNKLGQVTIECAPEHYFQVIQTLKEHPDLAFEQVSDLCGVDYSSYKNEPWQGNRFAVVCHLLSYQHNWCVRVRTFASDDGFPVVSSITPLYSGANWFEREVFDMYGILFEEHPDLRRILTDYGFVGHPMRKDFPVYGEVEMIYDPEQKRIVYQPVSILAREVTPRIVREEHYGE